MESKIRKHLQDGIAARERLLTSCVDSIEAAARLLIETVQAGGCIYLFGNGGSASDAQHIEAELTGRYLKERGAINARALTANTSAVTAIANDYGFGEIFSRHLQFATDRDAAIGISTSGNSPNVVKGLAMAKSRGAKTVALTGIQPGAVGEQADVCVAVPQEMPSNLIQELHIAVGHIWCQLIEDSCSG